MTVDTRTLSFEDELNALRRSNRLTGHPFVKQLLAGEATMEQLKVFAILWYFHTVAFPTALANLLARCRIPQLRAGLSEGLYEEETGKITGTAGHVSLYYDFLSHLGISREFVDRHAYMSPGMGSVVHWYHYVTTQLDPVVGIAALAVAAEGQNVSLPDDPGVSGLVAKALKEHHGFTDDDLVFWTLHDTADQEHSGTGVRLLVEFAVTDQQQEMVRAAIRHTQECMLSAFDDVLRYSWEDVTSNSCALFY